MIKHKQLHWELLISLGLMNSQQNSGEISKAIFGFFEEKNISPILGWAFLLDILLDILRFWLLIDKLTRVFKLYSSSVQLNIINERWIQPNIHYGTSRIVCTFFFNMQKPVIHFFGHFNKQSITFSIKSNYPTGFYAVKKKRAHYFWLYFSIHLNPNIII